MAEDPYAIPHLLVQLTLPRQEAGGSGTEGLVAWDPGVEDQGAGSP